MPNDLITPEQFASEAYALAVTGADRMSSCARKKFLSTVSGWLEANTGVKPKGK